jgi:hypothetical protein
MGGQGEASECSEEAKEANGEMKQEVPPGGAVAEGRWCLEGWF